MVTGLVNGVVYRSLLLFDIDNVNATPLAVGEESTVAIDIMEDDLDDESASEGARGLVRNKQGLVIRTCGIAGCQYKTGGTSMNRHKAAKHGIDVVWISCDQDGCDYKAKTAGSIKRHKAVVHDIDVRWFPCDQDGCDYKAKEAGDLKKHKQFVHDIDVQWHHCDQDGCHYKAKQTQHLREHKRRKYKL